MGEKESPVKGYLLLASSLIKTPHCCYYYNYYYYYYYYCVSDADQPTDDCRFRLRLILFT
jgi:hypothetical protein